MRWGNQVPWDLPLGLAQDLRKILPEGGCGGVQVWQIRVAASALEMGWNLTSDKKTPHVVRDSMM